MKCIFIENSKNIRIVLSIRILNFPENLGISKIEKQNSLYNLRNLYKIFRNFLKFFEIFWNFLKIFEIFWNFLKFFEIFWNFLKFFEVFWSFLKFFEIHVLSGKFKLQLSSSILVFFEFLIKLSSKRNLPLLKDHNKNLKNFNIVQQNKIIKKNTKINYLTILFNEMIVTYFLTYF